MPIVFRYAGNSQEEPARGLLGSFQPVNERHDDQSICPVKLERNRRTPDELNGINWIHYERICGMNCDFP